jgi:hypothetical protein
VPSTLVGKKAAQVVSISELESLYSSLIDNKKNTSVFLEPPMLFYQQGEREKTKEMQEMSC